MIRKSKIWAILLAVLFVFSCVYTYNPPVVKAAGKPTVAYSTHIEKIGWQGMKRNGDLAGTVGQGKRLEAIKINLENKPYSGNIEYRTHVQSYGWQPWVKNGAVSGTSGKAKRIEAIQIRLTGDIANYYDVYYRIQIQSYGWLSWAKNGAYSGSAGYAKRMEAIQVVLVEKGKSIDKATLNKQAKITSSTKTTNKPYVVKTPNIQYSTHVQTYGWQGYKMNGQMSGTSGQSKRLEGIKINLVNAPYDGGIRYKTHIQSIGWQGWKQNGAVSGTSGQAKRLEAICIELTGQMAQYYDVYYRVHAQSYGWLNWAKNGQKAGTEGYAKRLEGIQIVLVEKGKAAPGKTFKGITSASNSAYLYNKVSKQTYLVDFKTSYRNFHMGVREYDYTALDTYGNKYARSIMNLGGKQSNYGDPIHAEYNINGQYDHLKFTIAYADYDSFYLNNEGRIMIYADDRNIYSSGVITRNTRPISVDLDFGGYVHYLKIVWLSEDAYYRAPLILGTPILYKTR